MAKIDRVYWDSDCFLGYLKGEQDKIGICRGTADRAQEGDLIIITSAITLVEGGCPDLSWRSDGYPWSESLRDFDFLGKLLVLIPRL